MVILIMGRGRGLLLFERRSLEMHPGKVHCHRTTLRISTKYSVLAARLNSLCARNPVKKGRRNLHGRSGSSRVEFME